MKSDLVIQELQNKSSMSHIFPPTSKRLIMQPFLKN